jgi:hypothetical protein
MSNDQKSSTPSLSPDDPEDSPPVAATRAGIAGKLPRLIIVLAGIILAQIILYGPALCGRKVLLPLDFLALPDVYLPRTPETARIASVNIYLPDLLYLLEPARRFAVSEIHAGRLPMWMPYQYGGAPFIEAKFSPFAALQFCAASPIVLAWTQLAVALIAGLGAYAFFRRALGVGFWPAAISAWCYPLTGLFILWQGYPQVLTVCWLPWLLLAVDSTVRAASRWAPLGLALVTCLVVLSGHLDTAGQALLASGVYALWRLADVYGKQWLGLLSRKAALTLAAGWTLGLLLSAPQILPVLEYSQTGDRMLRRVAGEEERPPVGLPALPQTVLPDMYGGYGIWNLGNLRIGTDNQLESSAVAYAGLIATLFVAPLAWCSRRHRSANWFWLLAGMFGLAWCLNLPGFVSLLRLPGLNMLPHNRLVFVSSFAVLALTAIGLEVISQGLFERRWWLWLAPALLAVLAGWCIYRTRFLPEPVATGLAANIRQGGSFLWIRDLQSVQWVQSWFGRYYLQGALWCAAGLLGWLVLWLRPQWQVRVLPVAGAVMVAQLMGFGYGRTLQCDPALYFPRLPVLDEVARAAPGRVLGYNCLPASLASLCGLRDIRGYDGVDPAGMVELLALAAHPASPSPSYARIQFLVPKISISPENELRLSPILDMLGVRYVLFRKPPFQGARPVFQGSDYWVMANPAALPRVFIPERTELAADKRIRLNKLASGQFDPRLVAYVESPVNLPQQCRGTAEIVEETPTRIRISAHMETPGLIVLADRWDQGWKASLNGQPVPILRANHAIRGIVVPAGPANVEFRYAPASFTLGLRLFGLAAGLLIVWIAIILRHGNAQGNRSTIPS